MTMPPVEFYRVDPLTGCYNFLSFVEMLDQMSSEEQRKPFSILYLDLRNLTSFNETKGHSFGDSVLRWLGIVLQEESCSATYRISGDDFAVILTDGIHSEHEDLLKRLLARLNQEGEQLGIPTPPAATALIHFDTGYDFSVNDAMFHFGETMRDVRLNEERTISIFQAHDLLKSNTKVNEQNQDLLNQSWEVLRFIANQSINRVRLMGRMLDTSQKTSYQDTISGLPNLSAALLKMDKAINDSVVSQQPFSILLADGDNLRDFNNISYVTGDEVIQKTGAILSEHLRPGDFVARWRTGDEFLVILPNTTGDGAKVVAERFRLAVKEASKGWVLPSSITIGIATFPKHGQTVDQLVGVAEKVLKKGKDAGKDRVVLAE